MERWIYPHIEISFNVNDLTPSFETAVYTIINKHTDTDDIGLGGNAKAEIEICAN